MKHNTDEHKKSLQVALIALKEIYDQTDDKITKQIAQQALDRIDEIFVEG